MKKGTDLFFPLRAKINLSLFFLLALLGAEVHADESATRDLKRAGATASQPTDLSKLPRLALVIGNSEYESGKLRNPGNDAKDMAATLKALGFQVIDGFDLDRDEMGDKILEFEQQLKRKAGVGFFFYAGHGAQFQGRDYLIPVDSAIDAEEEIEYKAIAADSVLKKMQDAGNQLNVVVLDACRNNPFPRAFTRSGGSGLAGMSIPNSALGTMIFYAAAKGQTARDGDGRNGLFTKHLLGALRTPGLQIEQVFKSVLNGVAAESSGLQIPWQESSMTGQFYFIEPAGGAIPDPVVLPVALEPPQAPGVHWLSIAFATLAVLAAGAYVVHQRSASAVTIATAVAARVEPQPTPVVPLGPPVLTRQFLGAVYHPSALAYLCDANTYHVFAPLLPDRPLTVGRSSKSTVTLHDSTISAHHLQIGWDAAARAPWIEDTGSQNGIFVENGKRIPCNARYPITLDEVFWVVQAPFAFVLREPGKGA